MNEQQPTAELIQRYLERTGTEAELGMLGDRLVGDPQAAEALADAVRMDANLTAIFRAAGRTESVLAQLSVAQQRSDAAGVSRCAATAADRAPDLAPLEPTRWRSMRRRRLAWRVAAAMLLVAVTMPLVYRFARGPAAPLPVQAAISEVVSGEVLVDGARGQILRDGSTIQVIGNAPAVILLADGSEAEFEPRTTALLHGLAESSWQSVELNAGGGTFRVESNHGEFQVDTQLGCVKALGTEFSVNVQPSSPPGAISMKNMYGVMLAVAVVSGVVQVEVGGQNYVLGGGERRVFSQELRGGAPAGEPGRGHSGDRPRRPITEVDNASISLGGHGQTTSYDLAPDVTVEIDGRPGKVGELGVGMIAVVERKVGAGPVVSIKVEGPTIGGEVTSIDFDKQTISIASTSRKGTAEQTLPYASGVVVTLDGQPAELANLQPGTSVALRLTVDKKTVAAIIRSQGRATKGVEPDQSGAGRGHATSVAGTVSGMDATAGTLTLAIGHGGGERTLTVATGATVTIDGKDATLGDIKSNDRAIVKLRSDQTTAAEVTIQRATGPRR